MLAYDHRPHPINELIGNWNVLDYVLQLFTIY